MSISLGYVLNAPWFVTDCQWNNILTLWDIGPQWESQGINTHEEPALQDSLHFRRNYTWKMLIVRHHVLLRKRVRKMGCCGGTRAFITFGVDTVSSLGRMPLSPANSNEGEELWQWRMISYCNAVLRNTLKSVLWITCTPNILWMCTHGVGKHLVLL